MATHVCIVNARQRDFMIWRKAIVGANKFMLNFTSISATELIVNIFATFMGKIIRPTYPKELSIGLLLLVFAISFFLSGQVFQLHGVNESKNIYAGMLLLTGAVILVVLILWEELLFPVKIKSEGGGSVFRNHRTKLINQILLFLAIPFIFVFIYNEYEVNFIRFVIWAAVCILAPVAGKLISGINNYNDFLKLTDETIEYQNNRKTGVFALKDVQQIVLIKDERKVLHKVQVITTDNKQVMIDLDEMEIEDFFAAIDKFISTHYKSLVKDENPIE